ncbi:hypothetical protein E4U42_001415 [Claviceps africana]|uniref:DUF7703 domain-containing protein n=1 Tax=Claviceps africana TaxID=83212 RepID=A0A8K0NEG8_9HYPO|nr:hypothetical protein E4U42_001415 [Claviceps africana]
MNDITKDLPMSMTIAAFTGISWYIGVEINISLFLLFKRRKGLYFWSCALSSWGVMLQPLFIILADFGVWNNAVPSIVMIYLTWLIMVIPQSWVLYSRLHLLMRTASLLGVIKFVLIFNSIVFSIPTIVIGTLAQATDINPSLASFNLIWDRIQLVVYFVQETSLSVLYIFQTRTYLRGRAPLRELSWSGQSTLQGNEYSRSQANDQKTVLWQLIYANTLIIALDIALLGIQCANLFHLQGAFKPCVYGMKLKIEFVILNRLINIIQQPFGGRMYIRSGPDNNGGPPGNATRPERDQRWWQNKSGADTTEDHDELQLVEGVVSGQHQSSTPSVESQTPTYHHK